jgi:hypothetical protein
VPSHLRFFAKRTNKIYHAHEVSGAKKALENRDLDTPSTIMKVIDRPAQQAWRFRSGKVAREAEQIQLTLLRCCLAPSDPHRFRSFGCGTFHRRRPTPMFARVIRDGRTVLSGDYVCTLGTGTRGSLQRLDSSGKFVTFGDE